MVAGPPPGPYLPRFSGTANQAVRTPGQPCPRIRCDTSPQRLSSTAAAEVTRGAGGRDLAQKSKLERFGDVPLVSISKTQGRFYPYGNYIKTIYYGMPPDLLPSGDCGGGYLAFLGRLSPEKGPDAAIRIAQRTGEKPVIAAKIDRYEHRYFKKEIKHLPELPHVHCISEVNNEQKGPFLGNAAALLFPIAWPEPFRLVMIEAMTCGTSVVDDVATGLVAGS